MTENRNNGQRQIAAAVYPLDGITVEVNTKVARVLVKKTRNGTLVAGGVQLANGTKIYGNEVIMAAGGSKPSKFCCPSSQLSITSRCLLLGTAPVRLAV